MTRISREITVFHGRLSPEPTGSMVGYGSLMDHYQLKVPLPEKLSIISDKHKRYDTDSWAIYTPRYQPEESLGGHLIFALRYEGLDLALLSALFKVIEIQELESWILSTPLSLYRRRIWFFYEWLTGTSLSLPALRKGSFGDALDTRFYYAGPSCMSKRQRIRNNLPGVPDFCPLVRRTQKLEHFIHLSLSHVAHEKTKAVHPDVLARAAAFLLLKDSRASFMIEGEAPGSHRAERWGKALAQGGQASLSLEELLRLQKMIIEDTRFTPLGLRTEGGFIGVHDRSTGKPFPDHISARHQDLSVLMEGMMAMEKRLKGSSLDAVIHAALLAFGFVFIHPFADGNGRLHRYLIHHVLAESGFAPQGVVFPVSAILLERIDEYRRVLEAYSKPRLDFIEWQPTQGGNVEVLNETTDLYRYFDATQHAEFLYECVYQTIEKNL